MKIAIASDHGGFELKTALIEHLKGRNFEVDDLGTNGPESVNYPEFGKKCAEYVAAGKAIVTEPLYYEVPFGFSEKRNYIVYDDVGSLISKCDYLLDNVSEVHSMEENNRKYYAEHLRPDMLVKDTLIQAGIL